MNRLATTIIFLVAALLISCGGGGSGDDQFDKLSATTSLRIGRSASASSPIATSAALDNGETIIVIFDPTTGLISEVLFKNQDGEVVRIVVDPSGRPIFAETSDTRINFLNRNDNSSDITIEQNGITLGTLNIPLQDETIGLLGGEELLSNALGIQLPEQRRQRGFLNAAVIATRTVGCAGRTVSSRFSVSSSFSNLSSNACNSQLLDEIVNVTGDDTQNLEEITVTNIPDSGNCNNTDSFGNAQSCTEVFGGKIEEASQKGVVGAFPTPTPKPTKPQKPEEPETPQQPQQPQDPLKTTFEGTWVGPTTADFVTTFCSDGTMTFNISTNGDHTCFSPNCLIAGGINNIDSTIFSLNGVLNHNADIAFTTSSTIFGIPTSGSGIGDIINDTTITGTFQNDQGCTGTFTVNKQ